MSVRYSSEFNNSRRNRLLAYASSTIPIAQYRSYTRKQVFLQILSSTSFALDPPAVEIASNVSLMEGALETLECRLSTDGEFAPLSTRMSVLTYEWAFVPLGTAGQAYRGSGKHLKLQVTRQMAGIYRCIARVNLTESVGFSKVFELAASNTLTVHCISPSACLYSTSSSHPSLISVLWSEYFS